MALLCATAEKKKRPHLSPVKRSRIYALLQEGHSTRVVAHREKVSQSTVNRVRKNKEATGSFANKPKSGRPRVVSVHDERKMLRLIASGECSTATDVQARLKTEDRVQLSAQTVRRTFQRNGLESRVRRKKPLLRKKHRQQRLEFARKYKNWTVEQWSKVVWSDESKFQIFGSDGRLYCWKRPQEPLRNTHVNPTVKHGGGRIMVWGCFTSEGIGNLCRIDGGLDSELYRRILSEDFFGTLDWYGLDVENVIFQHDNDPKHTAKKTKKWLKDYDVNVLPWPSQSPDLNPIEHLWNEVERRLRQLPQRPTSKEDLWIKLQEVWNRIELDFLTKLIESMPERVRDVLKAKGGYTRW